jgi:hypothetical protein
MALPRFDSSTSDLREHRFSFLVVGVRFGNIL